MVLSKSIELREAYCPTPRVSCKVSETVYDIIPLLRTLSPR